MYSFEKYSRDATILQISLRDTAVAVFTAPAPATPCRPSDILKFQSKVHCTKVQNILHSRFGTATLPARPKRITKLAAVYVTLMYRFCVYSILFVQILHIVCKDVPDFVYSILTWTLQCVERRY